MNFELTRSYIEELTNLVVEERKTEALELLKDLHAADIADVFENLETDVARYLFFQFEPSRASKILSELEDDKVDSFLAAIPGDIIANDLIQKIDTDDAADILQQLTPKLKAEILSHLKDKEHAEDIADLLVYDEDTAGGLMAKELIKVNYNWEVNTCITDIRNNHDDVEDAVYAFVVDDDNRLKGAFPLKKLITCHGEVKVSSITDSNIISVQASTPSEEVADIMGKYDLFVIPVVDDLNRLLGRITIDDIVDVIKEEAEKDYQMASGITHTIESSDSIFKQSRARLPWLFIGLFGGVLNSRIIGNFNTEIIEYVGLAMFLPLIAAMAGNVGVQSSTIMIQSIANKTIDLVTPFKKLLRELQGAMFTGVICASAIFIFNYFFGHSHALAITVSIALFSVIIFAALIGTLIPLILYRIKIDPAIATGPFITTLNDITGLLVYLSLARLIFGILS